jgi:large subunit ribosomal protein L29
MPLPKIEDIRSLSDQELDEQIVAAKKELFQLRFQKATRQTIKPHQFKHIRHRLAQLMTVEHERQLSSAHDSQAVTQEE